jgi:PAS domain S-box-containing protein
MRLRIPPPPPVSAPFAYGLAVALPPVATGAQLLLRPYVYTVPFALYFPAVFLVGYLGGLRPGLLSVVLSAVLGAWMFLPPYGSPRVEDLNGLLGLALFVAVGGLLAFSSALLREWYAERAEQERRFRSLVETIPQLVFTARADGSVDFVNGRFLEYAGIPVEALYAEGWTCALHPEDLPLAVAAWTRALARGERLEGAYRIRRYDGEQRWHLVSAVPLQSAAGRIRTWFGACTDIHVQKESERAMSEAIEARDIFLAVAGHELKTPLTAAQLQIQNLHRQLRQGMGETSALVNGVAATAASVERLGGLVGALLDVSRIASGRLALERERYDLSAALTGVADRFVDIARRNGCALLVEVEPGLQAIGDRLRIEQVVTNLLSNAIKFGHAQPVRMRVARQGEGALVTVADHGIGIAPELQARIFERFQRAVSARHFGGLGLGLWIARQIVEASGGTIAVASVPGHGSTFSVTLPLAGSPKAEPSSQDCGEAAAPNGAARAPNRLKGISSGHVALDGHTRRVQWSHTSESSSLTEPKTVRDW